jgi:hypothetical protein
LINAISGGRARLRSRESSLWIGGFIAVTAICLLLFVTNIWLAEIRSGNAWGLVYGTAAATLLLGAAAYGIRRRTMRISTRHGAGRSRTWLYLHPYGGSLFLLLVFMHSGFGLPSGWVTWWLWGLSLWTVASGFIGLALQRWIPKLLASGLSVEVHYDRIPELVDEIRQKAEILIEDCDEAIRGLYERYVAAALDRPTRRFIYFLDITGGIQSKLREFNHLKDFLTREEQDKLEELEQLYRAKLEMDAHFTLQHPLRWWLYAHLPASLLLLAFLAIHLAAVFFY